MKYLAGEKDDEDVMIMNEARRLASGRVQRTGAMVIRMIDEPGHPTGYLEIPLRRQPC